jgi:hypothetical protein
VTQSYVYLWDNNLTSITPARSYVTQLFLCLLLYILNDSPTLWSSSPASMLATFVMTMASAFVATPEHLLLRYPSLGYLLVGLTKVIQHLRLPICFSYRCSPLRPHHDYIPQELYTRPKTDPSQLGYHMLPSTFVGFTQSPTVYIRCTRSNVLLHSCLLGGSMLSKSLGLLSARGVPQTSVMELITNMFYCTGFYPNSVQVFLMITSPHIRFEVFKALRGFQCSTNLIVKRVHSYVGVVTSRAHQRL